MEMMLSDVGAVAFIVSLILYRTVYSWNFGHLGLDEEKISLSRVIVYNMKAFVAIPRTYAGQTVTLAEVPWPEHSMLFTSKAFPDVESQEIANCIMLQSVIAMDADAKGRLYVLDGGLESVCPPKIVVYDLRINKQLMYKELQNVPTDKLSSLVVDLNPVNGNIKVIIGDAGHTSLLVYNFKEHIWWRLILNKNFVLDENFILTVDDYIKIDEKSSFSLNQLAISKKSSVLYATSSESTELFSVDISELRRLEEPLKLYCNWYDYNGTDISFQYIGNKFGKSKAIFVDSRDYLFYFYERDYAILKWNTNTAFVDENIQVVMQDYALIPKVTQIFSDSLRQLWILNSKKNENLSYTVKLKVY